MNNMPLVSCIMPTADREIFVPLAIKYFQRQKYPNLELIIVDDGHKAIAHLIPNDPRIKYIRLEKKIPTVGQKRNYICSLAKGSIIVHWDDDDWYADNWVSLQVFTLLSNDADICGLSNLFFYSPLATSCWKYVYPDNEQPWVAGATMAYKKSFWETHPFQNIQVGEDNQFVWHSGGKVIIHENINCFVSIVHHKNTSPKYTSNIRWVPWLINDIKEILESDFNNYK